MVRVPESEILPMGFWDHSPDMGYSLSHDSIRSVWDNRPSWTPGEFLLAGLGVDRPPAMEESSLLGRWVEC